MNKDNKKNLCTLIALGYAVSNLDEMGFDETTDRFRDLMDVLWCRLSAGGNEALKNSKQITDDKIFQYFIAKNDL